jgi:endonuclease YncB( thermonuclease family)
MTEINWNLVNDKTPDFQNFLEDQEKICKCVKVIDGDTVKLVTDINGKLWKITSRLADIDSPELHSRNPKEKEFAYFIKDELSKKILNKILKVKFGSQEKYGRLLAIIYDFDKKECINDWLLENKYAVKYEGGKKTDWSLILI